MAAVDVYEEEPVLDTRYPLFALETSCARRTSAMSHATSTKFNFRTIFDQIVAYAAGKPINVVNPKVLEGANMRR